MKKFKIFFAKLIMLIGFVTLISILMQMFLFVLYIFSPIDNKGDILNLLIYFEITFPVISGLFFIAMVLFVAKKIKKEIDNELKLKNLKEI